MHNIIDLLTEYVKSNKKLLTERVVSSLIISVVVFSACALGCKNNGGMITPNPPVITDQAFCQAACDNLQSLGCQEAQPISMGTQCSNDADCKDLDGNADKFQTCVQHMCETSCTNFCISTENQGVWLDPICVSKIVTCDDINLCPAPRKPEPSCIGPACQSSVKK